MARVLVLNATYEPINVCTLRRAAVLLLKEKAELLERREGAIHSEHMALDRPDVIRLSATSASRARPTGARSPAARCSPATPGPASTAARASPA